MSTRPDRRLEAARKLRDRLREQGQHADAEVVDAVCRSFTTMRKSMKLLYRDNEELRASLNGGGDD